MFYMSSFHKERVEKSYFSTQSRIWRKKMKNVYIVDSVRTAIGKMGGTIKDVPVDFLGAKVIEEIVNRTGIE